MAKIVNHARKKTWLRIAKFVPKSRFAKLMGILAIMLAGTTAVSAWGIHPATILDAIGEVSFLGLWGLLEMVGSGGGEILREGSNALKKDRDAFAKSAGLHNAEDEAVELQKTVFEASSPNEGQQEGRQPPVSRSPRRL